VNSIMTPNQELFERVRVAIYLLFNDFSVPKDVNIANMERLVEELVVLRQALIDSVDGKEIRQ